MNGSPSYRRAIRRANAAYEGETLAKSIGEVASPLLAGFSLTNVIVISGDAGHFLLPGEAIISWAGSRPMTLSPDAPPLLCSLTPPEVCLTGGEPPGRPGNLVTEGEGSPAMSRLLISMLRMGKPAARPQRD